MCVLYVVLELRIVSMGQGQEVHARRLLQQGQQIVSDHVIQSHTPYDIIVTGWLGIAAELSFVFGLPR